MTKKLLITIFGILCFGQSKATETEKIWVVVQPTAQINKTIDFYLIVSNKAEIRFAEIFTEIDNIDGLHLFSNFTTQNTTNFRVLYTYAVPQRLGKIEIPPITITIDGVEHTSRPVFINVVESITIDENSVRNVLVLDREVYHLQDTIRMSLFQYSQFSRILNIRASNHVRDLTGITNIEEFPDAELKWYDWLFNTLLNFGWDNRKLVTLDGETYIRTELFRFYFIANQAGTFRFQPSVLEFDVYRSLTDWFDTLEGRGFWRFWRRNRGIHNVTVTSNPIEIVVQ